MLPLYCTAPRRNRSRFAPAFSLIELLVVIAVIAILATLIFPLSANIRNRSQIVQCMSNLRALHTGFMQFSTENPNEPFYDSSSGDENDQRWNRRIHPYLDNVKSRPEDFPGTIPKLYLCPSDQAPYYGRLSYGFNNYLDTAVLGSFENSPILFADSFDNFRIRDYGKPNPLPGSSSIVSVHYRHENKACYVRFSGQIETAEKLPEPGQAANWRTWWRAAN